ncbi:hypothetical protein [Marinobacter xiaoshiensis]|uniref:TerB family tellurite resistance protein n=1 Tax=Marinobacter xiaoshiensis TaxID=3073652 RepID=A0ABU2HK93_9GAMM|nr:hypothetical protein [Marinobacter sp. F60267]MDS1311493.1 hypothetical protein [Marinobacter sp. F60267]
MNRKDCIQKAKKTVFEGLDKSLSETLGLIESVDAISLISALIYSLGYESVNISESKSLVRFFGTWMSGDSEVLVFDKISKDISGPLEKEMPSTFFLVQSIEGILSNSLELPHEMRQKRIKSIIGEAGVTEDRYSLILKNWKSF